VGSNEKVVQSNGVDLCLETFGDPAGPAIVLLAGGASSMDYWEDGFCERLAAGSRFVVRFDWRDTGRSVSYPPGSPGYTGPDMVADVPALLDTLGIAQAHLVGVSGGGAIGMTLAIEYPDRVASLTLIATSSGPADDLPPTSPELLAGSGPEPDWSDKASVVDYLVADDRLYLGSFPYDEAFRRALIERVVERTTNMQSATTNHWILDGGEPLRPRLGQIKAPTLVLHGTEDPLFPFPHGEALANEIPGAELIGIEKMGHEHPPEPTWNVVVPAILRHTDR
jgi:pimeloyl-ACP methyl ester carboxylesterase